MSLPLPGFAHLLHLTDTGGLHEHALGTAPRPEHGYCVDDVARGLAAVCAEPAAGEQVLRLQHQYLAFLLDAQVSDGRFRNRRAPDLAWTDEPSVEDCWGRALGGLGAAVRDGDPALHDRALSAFDRAAVHRSPSPRATAFAGLGAALVLERHSGHAVARDLLADAVRGAGRPRPGPWPWPEPRLTYGNAALAELLVAGGSLLGDATALADGLHLLGWLLDVQTRDGHLSVVPVDGLGPADLGPQPRPPGFDQQPIEVATLAAACARAADVTGDPRWAEAVERAARWFLGDNDAGVPLLDEISGGGCDGLEPHGRNENQGAESTLAAITVLQDARRLALVAR